jgi:hypothetical protein
MGDFSTKKDSQWTVFGGEHVNGLVFTTKFEGFLQSMIDDYIMMRIQDDT